MLSDPVSQVLGESAERSHDRFRDPASFGAMSQMWWEADIALHALKRQLLSRDRTAVSRKLHRTTQLGLLAKTMAQTGAFSRLQKSGGPLLRQ